MNYSQEQIEQKRLLALQRKKQAQTKTNSPNPTKVQNSFSPISTNNLLKDNNTSRNGGRRYTEFLAKFQHNEAKNNSKFNKQKKRFSPIEAQTFFGQHSRITGKCYMISDERFVLDVSYFHPLIQVLQTIPSRLYDMKTKNWNFHMKDYENLMGKMIQLKSDVEIIGLPKTVLQIFRKNDTSDHADTSIDLSEIDPVLLENLMPFQREGVCYGISKEGRCMIADDMGLGKTIQALGIAHYFRKNWPLLIVVPSSVRYQWSDAIFTFLPSLPMQYVQHFTNGKDFIDNNSIVITSYDLLVRSIDSFERRTFGFIIVDESHALKSVKTARFKAAQRVVAQARHVLLLSGTPALSRPIELYSQINLIMPNFMRYQDFGIRYCAGEKTSFGWDFSGSSNMQELQLLLKHTCVIRRVKSNVLNQLPSKKREVIVLDPDLIKAGTKEMEQVSKKLERKVLNGIERHSLLIQYYHETSMAKQKAICDYVSNLLKEKQKIVIFAHHQNILDAICDVAELMNIKYIRIDGKTNSERRKYQVDQFQTCPNYLAAILSITAANAGITLTAAKLVVFAELFWNPGILCQAEDRVHRIGQNNSVVIRYLVAKQTADDYLWPLIEEKMNVLNEVGFDQDFSLNDISITKHALERKQKMLNFSVRKENPQEIKPETVPSNEYPKVDAPLENSSSTTTDEYKDLLEIDEEDFKFCEWDDIQ